MSGAEDGELKGGHPPAVRAGGMRITQHKLPREEREVKPVKESEETKPSTRRGIPRGFSNSSRKSSSQRINPRGFPRPKITRGFFHPPKTLLISGFPAKGNSDFPPEAVQKFHEKPIPTHDAPRHTNNSRPIVIQQPRK